MLKMPTGILLRLSAMLLSVTLFLYNACEIRSLAEGFDEAAEGTDAECVYVCEMATGKVLYSSEADKIVPMGHLAKLMTVLICADELAAGRVALGDEVTASDTANSMPSPQIWLRAGDRITVDELLRSITMGNANDACVALAEKLSGSTEKHTERMNGYARTMGMESTHFDDCCGISEKTVTSAYDLSLLTKSLIKYNNLTDYFTKWMDRIKRQEVELVNTNRLVRNTKGILGFKFCAGKNGSDLVTAVNRRNMTVCVILLECKDKERAFGSASKLLDTSFEDFRVYTPEIDEKYLEDITLTKGQKDKISVKQTDFAGFVLARGTFSDVECAADVPETVNAPVYEGDVLGRLTYSMGGETLAEIDIIAAETVEEMDWSFGIRRSLCNLFNI